MGKRKQAKQEVGRLERKLEKRKAQQRELKKLIENIKTQQWGQKMIIVDECEAEAIDDRVAYYDEFRVEKKWPRISLNSDCPILSTEYNLLELLHLSRDVFHPIVTYLAPSEYRSLLLTCSDFQKLLESDAVIQKYVDSFLLYMEKNKIPFKHDFLLCNRKTLYVCRILDILQKATTKYIVSNQVKCRKMIINDRRIRPSDSLFKQNKIYFCDTKTGEFGEMKNELLFSDLSWKKRMQCLDFQKKYKFSPNRNLLKGSDIEYLNIRPISELQLEKYGFIDIYMIDYNSPYNYYRCLTVPNESIHLFYLEKGGTFDPYFDWIATRAFLKSLIK